MAEKPSPSEEELELKVRTPLEIRIEESIEKCRRNAGTDRKVLEERARLRREGEAQTSLDLDGEKLEEN